MSHIKNLINNLINQRADEATLDLHQYLQAALRSSLKLEATPTLTSEQEPFVAVLNVDTNEYYRVDDKSTATTLIKCLKANGVKDAKEVNVEDLDPTYRYAFDGANTVTSAKLQSLIDGSSEQEAGADIEEYAFSGSAK